MELNGLVTLGGDIFQDQRVAWSMSDTKTPKSFCRVTPPVLTGGVFSLKHWPLDDFTKACNSHNGASRRHLTLIPQGPRNIGKGTLQTENLSVLWGRVPEGLGRGTAYFFTLLYAMYYFLCCDYICIRYFDKCV